MTAPATPGTPLTKRELAVIQGVARGLTYGQLARDRGVAHSTVRSLAQRASERLGTHDQTSTVLAYFASDQCVKPAAQRLHERWPMIGVGAWERTIHAVLGAVGVTQLETTNGTAPAPAPLPAPATVAPPAPLPTPAPGATVQLEALRAQYAQRRAQVVCAFADDDQVARALGWSHADEAVAAVRLAHRAVVRMAGALTNGHVAGARHAAVALQIAESDTLRVALATEQHG